MKGGRHKTRPLKQQTEENEIDKIEVCFFIQTPKVPSSPNGGGQASLPV
jgi:hypothetical protein